MIKSNHSQVRELTLLGLLALLWGSSYVFTKIAIAEVPPVTLVAVRVTIAAIVLCAVMKCQGIPFPRDGLVWRRFLVQAFFNSIGAWVLLAWGQQYVDSGLASVLNSTAPIFIFFITLFWTRHESLSWLKLFGAGLGVMGVALIVGIDVMRGLGDQVAGQLAALGGAMLYAVAAIYGKKFNHLPATTTAAATMFCASVCLIPASLILDAPWTLDLTLRAVLALLVVGVFSTAAAFLLYFRLLKTLGSLGVASQSYLRAGVGVMLGVWLLGEAISLEVAVGLACAVLGVFAINAPIRKRQPADSNQGVAEDRAI